MSTSTNGDEDYQASHELPQECFDQVDAPAKGMFAMEHITYGLMESKSRVFSEILHEVTAGQRALDGGNAS